MSCIVFNSGVGIAFWRALSKEASSSADSQKQWSWRARLRENPEGTHTFGSILFQSINVGLGKILDQQAVQSVNFYVDPHIALNNPEEYSKSLKRMFQNESKRLTDEICSILASRFSLQKNEWSDFAECVALARQKYASS